MSDAPDKLLHNFVGRFLLTIVEYSFARRIGECRAGQNFSTWRSFGNGPNPQAKGRKEAVRRGGVE